MTICNDVAIQAFRRLYHTSWGPCLVLLFVLGAVPVATQAQSDSLELPLPHGEDLPNPVETPGGVSLDFPDVIEYGVDYDENSGQYVVRQRLGIAYARLLPAHARLLPAGCI